MIILSVHLGHDSSVCILNNGNLEKYFLTERYTRKKHDYDTKFIFDLVVGIASKLKEKLDLIQNKTVDVVINTIENVTRRITEEYPALSFLQKVVKFLKELPASTKAILLSMFPGIQEGGFIAQTGLAVVHKGETVIPATEKSVSKNIIIYSSPTFHLTANTKEEVDVNEISDILMKRWEEYMRTMMR